MEKFKFMDYNTNGEIEVFYEAEEPAFLVGLDSEIRLRYGEYFELIPLMHEHSKIERVAIISLPKNQEKIDGLFQSTGLTKRYIQAYKEFNNIENKKKALAYEKESKYAKGTVSYASCFYGVRYICRCSSEFLSNIKL